MLGSLSLWAFLLISATASSQDLSGYAFESESLSATVRGLAASPDSKDRAWAAHLVGKHRLKDEAGLLLSLLSSHSGPQQGAWAWVDMSALDGLIQIGATAPGVLLIPLFSKYPDQVIILLSRSPEENQDLFHLLLDEPVVDAHWLALNNLLAETKAPGLAARLLRELDVQVSLTVSDMGLAIPIKGGVSSGTGVCTGMGVSPPGLPPWVRYRLIDRPVRGAVATAPGPRPVFFQRLLPGEAGHPAGSVDRNRFRLEYVALLLRVPVESLQFRDRNNRAIRWSGSGAYLDEIERIRWELDQSFQALLGKLLEAGLVTLQEARTIRPNLEWTIRDLRPAHSDPLPEIEGMNP